MYDLSNYFYLIIISLDTVISLQVTNTNRLLDNLKFQVSILNTDNL